MAPTIPQPVEPTFTCNATGAYKFVGQVLLNRLPATQPSFHTVLEENEFKDHAFNWFSRFWFTSTIHSKRWKTFPALTFSLLISLILQDLLLVSKPSSMVSKLEMLNVRNICIENNRK